MEMRCELDVPVALISGIKLQANEKRLVPAFSARRVRLKVVPVRMVYFLD
jgi:hypothetical protein